MSDRTRFPAWIGHRACQVVGAALVVIGVLNLWFRSSDGDAWFRIAGAVGQLFLFIVAFATTILARRQNRRDLGR
jgi:hypothetical protein